MRVYGQNAVWPYGSILRLMRLPSTLELALSAYVRMRDPRKRARFGTHHLKVMSVSSESAIEHRIGDGQGKSVATGEVGELHVRGPIRPPMCSGRQRSRTRAAGQFMTASMPVKTAQTIRAADVSIYETARSARTCPGDI
jgi:hypothetical protein